MSAYENARRELHEIHAGLSHALAAVERLKAHGGLAPMAVSVAGMLADDVQRAAVRYDWLRSSVERGDGGEAA